MKPNPLPNLAAWAGLCLPLPGIASAEPAPPDADRTLAPYFHVAAPGDAGGDAFPLKSTVVDAKIAGVIADVRVTQVYANAGNRPLEALYVFPGSTRAAVHGLEMRIGDRTLTARVRPRAEARQTYETAKTEGKSAALLEQQRPNVFQMNVANILPGDTVTVELRYTERIVPEAGEHAFVFPTVVGPRYGAEPGGPGTPDTAAWVKNPYLPADEVSASPATFRLTAAITAGMPIRDLHCASHEVTPEFTGPDQALVQLSGDAATAANRDFILRYRLTGPELDGGLLLASGPAENFFLLTVQPPRRVIPEHLPPREYVFVLDVSGSMDGFPIQTAKELLRELLASLRPEDRFNVLLFAGGSRLLSPASLPGTPANLRRALDVIDGQRGGGGTELMPALEQALALPSDEATARSLVVITDGFVSCEARAFDLIRRNLNRANLFAFGIGSSVNRHLIEGMARAGQGEPFVVTRPDEAAREARRFREYIASPVLTRLSLEADGFEIHDLEPAVLADVLADRPVVVTGKWKGERRGTLTLRGHAGDGPFQRTFSVAEAEAPDVGPALGYLWARSRIATLGDGSGASPGAETEARITSLGMTYNLLTAYTSFVAVDSVPRLPGGVPAEPVKQPLPLPQGVGNLAVGAPVPTTPEPETWLLLLAAGAALAWHRVRRPRPGATA
jgi:Ca-activated chloride channel family protein